MESEFLKPLPQYHFERDEFISVFKKVFTDEEILDLESACQDGKSLSEFYLYYDEGEFYIIHLSSGTILNWYKHLGRTNTCNKEEFSLSDLDEFLELLKDDINS